MEFFQIANNLSLDFVNTLAADNGKSIEMLTSFDDLVSWSKTMRLLTDGQAKKLSKDWRHRKESEEFVGQALEFRRRLLEMFDRIEKTQIVKSTTINAINKILSDQIGFPEVEETESGFVRRYRAAFTEPHQLLIPIAEAAADLLCYGTLTNVKKCENEKCVLLFYDTSKNHSRRWCAMAHCGNRAKAAKFYQQKKARK